MRELGGPDYASGDEQRVRDHLGKFGFQGDRAFEPVARLSGGEKARLTLALLVARRPNLLLLDEPTNHLDIEMRHALTVALQGFEGGLIVVSHDRHLIKTVADTLWLAADGKLEVFDGDLDDYQSWLRARAKSQSGLQAAAEPRKAPRADPVNQWRRELTQIEKKIAAIAAERALIEDELSKADSGLAGDALGKLLEKHARLTHDADKWEARWLEIGTAIEDAEAAGTAR
jgi:ATP-binding cassette subfamily F protein 3